jgi:hypothetical protein
MDLDIQRLLNDEKFLEKCKYYALTHKNDPMSSSWIFQEHYQAMMWTRGILDSFASEGYKLEKKDNGN